MFLPNFVTFWRADIMSWVYQGVSKIYITLGGGESDSYRPLQRDEQGLKHQVEGYVMVDPKET